MARVAWSPTSFRLLLSIRQYIAANDPLAAAMMEDCLRKAGDGLATFPNRGRPKADGTRELVTVPPYVIRYQVVGDVVRILTIRHGRQAGGQV